MLVAISKEAGEKLLDALHEEGIYHAAIIGKEFPLENGKQIVIR